MNYPKAEKYTDLGNIYAQCSGPGGLKLAEFIADKLGLIPSLRLLDIGTNRGIQTCFLAKEYGVNVVGIDPGDDRSDGLAHIDHLMDNAIAWGVEDQVMGVKSGVPDTRLPADIFDAAYSSTTFEMIRGYEGEYKYRECLWEVLRVLRPGGLFGYSEPMHLDVLIPNDLAPLIPKEWICCFTTLETTVNAFVSVGFEIVDAGYADDAHSWWQEYARHDPFSQVNPNGEATTIKVDGGRWLSFGYVIGKKPEKPIKKVQNGE